MRAKVHIYKKFGTWVYCFRSWRPDVAGFLVDSEIQAARAFCARLNSASAKRRDGTGG